MCFTCATYTDSESVTRLQKWFTNCKLIMSRLIKPPWIMVLIRIIVHNRLWNSEIVAQWIQQKYPGKLQKQTLKNGSRIQKLWTTITYTVTMCLPACLWAQIAKTPFNYTITAQTLLAKCDHYRFQRLILQFPPLGKKYRIGGMFTITRALRTPRLRCWAKRKWLHVLWDNWNHFLKFE